MNHNFQHPSSLAILTSTNKRCTLETSGGFSAPVWTNNNVYNKCYLIVFLRVFAGMSEKYSDYKSKVCIPNRITQGMKVILGTQLKQAGTYIR